MLNKTRGIFWLLSAQNSFERLINTCKLCKLCPCKYFMKTIKGSINYGLFCFSDIHSFNFNFTLTVLMCNLATKNFIWVRAGSRKPCRTRRVGKVAGRGGGGRCGGKILARVPVARRHQGEARDPSSSPACEKGHAPLLGPDSKHCKKAINKHRLC